MEKSKLVAGLVFAGFTVALSNASMAADGSGPGRPTIESLDSNGDGVISFVEFQESGSNALARLDADQNDVLTLDEFLNSRPMRGPRFDNRNGNASGDNEEFTERREQMRERMAARMTEQFHAMDTDGDEMVTLAEFQEANFERMDRNGDGVLSAEELEPPRRGGRRGRGGPGGQNGGQSPPNR